MKYVYFSTYNIYICIFFAYLSIFDDFKVFHNNKEENDPSYTSKLIKKFSGKTFKQLVNEERMRQSLILLQNKETPIYTIAEDVGFSNLTSFYKKFEEFTGLKPQEYREKNT